MPQFLLPVEVPLRSARAVRLSTQPGTLVLDEPVFYPDFFVESADVAAAHAGFARPKYSYSERWPAQPTADGLLWDPDWNVFAAFFASPRDNSSFDHLLTELALFKVDWSLSCPVVEGPKSVIGQVMLAYGANVGAQPGNPGLNPTASMTRYPLSALLSKAEDLPSFRDEGCSLLDMAMTNQLWGVAQWLWDKGVRPTPAHLEGPYLESLVIASHALQESPVMGFLPSGVDRPQWLQGWLDRFEQEGGIVSDAPFSTWRQRLMDKNAGPNSGLRSVVDTVASLWISRAIHANTSSLPHIEKVPHQVGLFDTWVGFWARQGVDLEEVNIPVWSTAVVGFSAYCDQLGFKSNKSAQASWEGWKTRLDTVYEAAQLDLHTPQATHRRASARL